MPTRFYLPASGTPDASPAFGTGWSSTTSATRHPTATTRSGTALANGTARAKVSQAGAQNRLDRQFVSDQLAAQTITGNFTAVLQGLESTISADAWLQVVIRVVSADGATQRGVLFAGSTASVVSATVGAENQEFTTALQSRIKPSTSLTSVAAQAGDRLVIEVGYRAITANTNTVTLRYGDPASGSDAALTAGTTSTTIVPWVELSQTLTFYTPPAGSGGQAARITADANGFKLTGTSLPPTTSTFTSFIYLDADLNRYSTFYEPSANSSSFYIQCSTVADGVTLGIAQPSTGINMTTPMTLGAWWKFVIIVTPSTVKIRASPIGSSLVEGSLARAAGTVSAVAFGYSIAYPGEFVNGRMAGMKLWSSELTLAECEAEFTQYRAVKTTDLIGEYTMWDGAAVTDTSGANRPLTSNGTLASAAGPANIPLGGEVGAGPAIGSHFHVLA